MRRGPLEYISPANAADLMYVARVVAAGGAVSRARKVARRALAAVERARRAAVYPAANAARSRAQAALQAARTAEQRSAAVAAGNRARAKRWRELGSVDRP